MSKGQEDEPERVAELEERVKKIEDTLDIVIVLDTVTVTQIHEQFGKVRGDVAGVQASIGGDLPGTLQGRSVLSRLVSVETGIDNLARRQDLLVRRQNGVEEALKVMGGSLESLDARLAVMDERFDSIDERFGVIDDRFDSIDERFGVIDERFDSINDRFAVIDKRFDSIDERFGVIDERFDSINDRFAVIDERFDSVDERFRVMDNRLESLESSVGTLKTDVGALAGGMDEVLRILRGRGGS
ncbi:hypothetical protein AB0H76_03880 [Nocardia sp. NPDC050712]|uniref:hypothetical protein n=1 Tax=Nocardia sp. NPDC050712 TaxID=3155518 RepID=UPI0033C3E1C6